MMTSWRDRKKIQDSKIRHRQSEKKMPIMSQKLRATRLASTDSLDFEHGEKKKRRPQCASSLGL